MWLQRREVDKHHLRFLACTMDTMVLVVLCVFLWCWLAFNQESAPELSCVQVDLFGRLSHHREFRERPDLTLLFLPLPKFDSSSSLQSKRRTNFLRVFLESKKAKSFSNINFEALLLGLKLNKNCDAGFGPTAKKATQAKIKRNIKKLFSLAARPSLALFRLKRARAHLATLLCLWTSLRRKQLFPFFLK